MVNILHGRRARIFNASFRDGVCYMAFVETMILWSEGWDRALIQSFAYPRIYSLLGKAPVLVRVENFEPYLHSGFVLKLVNFLKKIETSVVCYTDDFIVFNKEKFGNYVRKIYPSQLTV